MRTHFALMLLGLAGFGFLAAADDDTVFISPTECKPLVPGVYRWAVKTDGGEPPNVVPRENRLAVHDLAGWPDPDEKVHSDTPRFGREREWFELTGRVARVFAEDDGDLHVQLADADGKHKVQVVVEIPCGPLWAEPRKAVFAWSPGTRFPRKAGELLLRRHPLVRVVGKAFWDGQHKSDTPNRRGNSPHVAIWELHPVCRIQEIAESKAKSP